MTLTPSESPSQSFWKRYDEKNELQQVKELETLPLLKGFKYHNFSDKEATHILGQYIQSYLEDYSQYKLSKVADEIREAYRLAESRVKLGLIAPAQAYLEIAEYHDKLIKTLRGESDKVKE